MTKIEPCGCQTGIVATKIDLLKQAMSARQKTMSVLHNYLQYQYQIVIKNLCVWIIIYGPPEKSKIMRNFTIDDICQNKLYTRQFK